MPTVDLLPSRLDVKYRPGSAYALRGPGPVGWLTGRTFTATLGGDTLPVTEDGDTLVIEIPDAVTTEHSVSRGAVPFILTETGGNDVAVGTWTPSMTASTAPTIDFDVTLNGLDVDLTIVVGVGDVIDGGTPAGSGPDILDGGSP